MSFRIFIEPCLLASALKPTDNSTMTAADNRKLLSTVGTVWAANRVCRQNVHARQVLGAG